VKTATEKKPKAVKAPKIAKVAAVREAKVAVSELNISKAAMRLLSQRLVSTEVSYVQRTLGATATQGDIDTQVLAVRKLPWATVAAE
jgi:hypothetical protein